jgi:hypothetical protein
LLSIRFLSPSSARQAVVTGTVTQKRSASARVIVEEKEISEAFTKESLYISDRHCPESSLFFEFEQKLANPTLSSAAVG